MAAEAETEKAGRTLSCHDAQLILWFVPLLKSVKKMGEKEIAAVTHYLYCKDCRNLGLARILDAKLSCKEIILEWAKAARAMWHSCAPGPFFYVDTLAELYAVEHVWGKYQWVNSMGGCGWDVSTACRERPCQALHSYWARVPMSSSAGDGPGGVIHLFPFLVEIFLKEGWSLSRLLEIQKNRITAVLKDIKNRKVTVSSGHYHSINELMEEMREHIAILQKLAVHSRA